MGVYYLLSVGPCAVVLFLLALASNSAHPFSRLVHKLLSKSLPCAKLNMFEYELPWLIWIQLLVMLLLIALLYFFSTCALDPSDETTTATTNTTVAITSKSTSGVVFCGIQQVEKPVAKHHSRATVVINTQVPNFPFSPLELDS